MARIKAIDPSQTEGKTSKLLDGVQQQLGAVPNIFRTFAHSPAVLDFYLSQSNALSKGVLDPKIREQIALAAAGENSCNYCASAHTAIGKSLGLEDGELTENLNGRSQDARIEAALTFTRRIIDVRGQVTDDDLQSIRDAGFSETEIVEIIANVALNMFTNYFNHIADTDVDFPLVDAKNLASAA